MSASSTLPQPTAAAAFPGERPVTPEVVREHNLIAVVVLHDINQASLYSDHIVALSDGKVICQGTAEEVVTAENIASIFNIRPTIQPDEKTKKPVIIGYELIKRGE